jgi:hypothetical protein
LLRGTLTWSLTRIVRQGGEVDKKLSDLFQQWLAAFEAMQVASSEADVAKAHLTLGEIEAKMVDTPAEGMEGLVVKLGLHWFLNEHADAASAQSDSAYRDLARSPARTRRSRSPSGSRRKRLRKASGQHAEREDVLRL